MRISGLLLPSLVCVSWFLAGCSGGNSNTTAPVTTTPTPTVSAPTVASVSPTKLVAGAPATVFTVTGTGFTSSTVIQVAGVAESTSFASSTQVLATVPASQLASGVMLSVVANNGSASSAAGAAVNVEVDNPAPTIAQFVPVAFTTGTPGANLAVSGSGFVPGTVVQVNGAARSTAYASPTQVFVLLTAADLGSGGSLSLMAVNAAPGGGTSAAASVPVNNPVPGAITLAPTSLLTGATSATTVTVNGSNFLPSSTVQVGLSARATTYVSPSQLTFQLTVADQATAGRLVVSVVNPAPGGGTSPTVGLTLNAPTPTPVLTQVSPSQFVTGSGASSISASGTNLTSNTVILWNGTALTTSFVSTSSSGYTITSTVPASLLSSVGTANVTVSSPTAPVPMSNSLPVTIVNPPAPTLTQISPAAVPINTAAALTLYGTGFTSASTVSFNGASLAATFVNSTTLTILVPAASVNVPGNYNISVTTPAPGGGTTAGLAVTAYIGIVNNSMIYNPVRGLFYVSVPSSAGTPYGNSVVSVDPATGTLGTPIFVGSEPDKMAITSDGRYLWVGLDGSGTVRKVDLTTGVAGIQFTPAGSVSYNQSPNLALALAALPGATDSVVVSATYAPAPIIYDSGVARGTVATGYYYNNPYALLVDGTRNEIYAGYANGYNVYTYNASGLTVQTSISTGQFASSTADEMQIAGGRLYTDFGMVRDPETTSLFGSFYNTGNTIAVGPTTVDVSLGKAFVLDYSGASGYYPYGYNQIQVFDTTTFNQTIGMVIPVNLPTVTGSSNTSASRLTRWGANGLAFRTNAGVVSLRSNLVKDLSTTSADLGVTIGASGGTSTGANTTYTVTVTNAGPAGATNVTLTPMLPSTGVLVSAGAPCSAVGTQSCDLGALANGGAISVTYVVTQNAAGSIPFSVQVAGSENDAAQTNNQATNTTTVTGNPFSLVPAIVSLSPATVQSGAADTVVTVNGAGFTSGSSVLWNGAPLTTSYVSASKLTATVPAANLASLGWGAITVSTPAPGGGVSAPTTLTVFQVLSAGFNHILYDPFDRKLYASVDSGTASITGNSIAAITPETGTIGTPVLIGSQPTKMAISDDGNLLYAILAGASSVARFNLLTQQADYSASLTTPNANYNNGNVVFRDVAVLPGSENTIALDFGSYGGLALVDFTPSTKTAALRGGTSTSILVGSSLQFLNAQNLLLDNVDGSATLDKYPITSAGFSYSTTHTSSVVPSFSAFKLQNKLAFANRGGVADPTLAVAVPLGVYQPVGGANYANSQVVEPDSSLSRIFFLAESSASYSTAPDSIVAYDKNSFVPVTTVSIPFSTVEGVSTYAGVDLVRWGQDGLAALTSSGRIYLLRGPVVVPQELNINGAAGLTASSAATIAHGSGNTVLTLTGSNFVPGVAVTWNGGYRTTTIVDATHVTVALAASDVATAGTGSLVATNPGATGSATLTVAVN